MRRVCIVCGEPIWPCDGPADSVSCPPDNATVWNSTGNWGSSLLDEQPGTFYCEIFVCDPCLKDRMHLVNCIKPVVRSRDHDEYIGTLNEVRTK